MERVIGLDVRCPLAGDLLGFRHRGGVKPLAAIAFGVPNRGSTNGRASSPLRPRHLVRRAHRNSVGFHARVPSGRKGNSSGSHR